MHARGPEDAAIGARIRARRHSLGMSQEQLAKALGVTFQQVQKYEHGVNRVSGSRLLATARTLRCPVADLVGENTAIEPLIGLGTLDLDIARAAAGLSVDNKHSILSVIRAIKLGQPTAGATP